MWLELPVHVALRSCNREETILPYCSKLLERITVGVQKLVHIGLKEEIEEQHFLARNAARKSAFGFFLKKKN